MTSYFKINYIVKYFLKRTNLVFPVKTELNTISLISIYFNNKKKTLSVTASFSSTLMTKKYFTEVRKYIDTLTNY